MRISKQVQTLLVSLAAYEDAVMRGNEKAHHKDGTGNVWAYPGAMRSAVRRAEKQGLVVSRAFTSAVIPKTLTSPEKTLVTVAVRLTDLGKTTVQECNRN